MLRDEERSCMRVMGDVHMLCHMQMFVGQVFLFLPLSNSLEGGLFILLGKVCVACFKHF